MKLTVFNGSPRGKQSNSTLLSEQFLQGFSSVAGNSHEVFHLHRVKEQETFRQAFAAAEAVLLVFPLYTDSMPGIVKAFIEETLAEFVGRPNNPPIAFIIHCGFPETINLRGLEKYLEKLARRLDCRYVGTVLKPSSEGIAIMPPSMTNPLYTRFQQLGRHFAETGELDAELVKQIAGRERLPGWVLFLARLGAIRLPLFNFYWNMQLRKNQAYEKRFAKPYK